MSRRPSQKHWVSVSFGEISNGVELPSGKVAELVKSFEHVNEILDGFRYEMGVNEILDGFRYEMGAYTLTC